jgi:hypothetical protein
MKVNGDVHDRYQVSHPHTTTRRTDSVSFGVYIFGKKTGRQKNLNWQIKTKKVNPRENETGGQNSELLNVEVGGTYCYHFALKELNPFHGNWSTP